MTIARDIRTGEVLGQCTTCTPRGTPLFARVVILTKNGYYTVPRSSVRLEDVR